jgi:hypothetical protein
MKSRFAQVLVALGITGAAAGVGFGLSTAVASAASPSTTTPSSSTPSTTTPPANTNCPHPGSSNGATTGFFFR